MPITRNSKGQFAGGALPGRAFTAGSLLKGSAKRNALASTLRSIRSRTTGADRPTGRLGAIQQANRLLLGRVRAADRLKRIHTARVKEGVLGRLGYLPKVR